MPSKENKDSALLDLNDPATRKMLHDDKALNHTAVKAGLGLGIVTTILGTVESLFLAPEFIKKFKETASSATFTKRLLETAKNNRILTVLVTLPVSIFAAASTYGYFSAKSTLKKKRHELTLVEQQEGQTIGKHPAEGAEQQQNANKAASSRPWVDRTQQTQAYISR